MPSCFPLTSRVRMQDLNATPKRRNVLEDCINRLSQSADSWKSRVQVDPELKKLGAGARIRKGRQLQKVSDSSAQEQPKFASVSHVSRSAASSVDRGLERLHGTSASVSPPAKIVHVSTSHVDDRKSSVSPPAKILHIFTSDEEDVKPSIVTSEEVVSATTDYLEDIKIVSPPPAPPLPPTDDLDQVKIVPASTAHLEDIKILSAPAEHQDDIKVVPVSMDDFEDVKPVSTSVGHLDDVTPTRASTGDLDEITVSTPRLIGPFKAAARGRVRSKAAERLIKFSEVKSVSAPVTPVDYRIKQSEEDDDGKGLAASAIRGLQSKVDYTAVHLKKRDVRSGYPDLMLMRIKGERRPDVRLVAPKFQSLSNYGVYMLITPKKLFFYHGRYANLREKTKATIIEKSICSKNGELGCQAKLAENVNEVSRSEFWKLLGCSGPNDIQDDESTNRALEGDEPFESVMAGVNIVFEVHADHAISTISSGVVPPFSIFNPKSNLIFDFGSEIYVWAGRSADRNGTQRATAYAKELQQQSAPHITDSQLLFGDDFSEKRPGWCILIKLTQGLGDCLFREKFSDWKQVTAIPLGKWQKPKEEPKAKILTEAEEDQAAANLAKTLLAFTPSEAQLTLEETEIERQAENIFTEELHYYAVEGENQLTELPKLNLLFKNACYVVKWNYRVERTGIHRLAAKEGDLEHDTGRQRVCFFFWLGSETTKREQGVCALALRNFDKDKRPHERVVQGQECYIFLSLFNSALATVGYDTRIFLVHSAASLSECHMEELPAPVTLRSHAAYIIVNDKVTVWYGKHCSKRERECAKYVAERLVEIEHSYLECINKDLPVAELEESDGSFDLPVIETNNCQTAPRVIRLIETEGSDLSCAQWDTAAPFSFRQSELRDTMIVDQGNGIWLWTDGIATTYTLRVASHYSKSRKGFAKVICKTKEPEEFKALFPMWEDFRDEGDENEENKRAVKRSDPVDVEVLLKERNQKWPLAKLVARDLPEGVDMKRLEQYLTDADFEGTFKMVRSAFYALPLWKQIDLRKKHNLF